MANENKGGPAAQARARTIFPNTGGSIIGGIGSQAVQAGPVLSVETRVAPAKSSRVLPVDLISAHFERVANLDRLKPEQVSAMREGQARIVANFKAAQTPDDRAVPVTTPAPAAKATTAAKKK